MGCIDEVGEELSAVLEDVVWRGTGFNDDDNVDELPDELVDEVGGGGGGWLLATGVGGDDPFSIGGLGRDEEGGGCLDEYVDRRWCCTAPAW